MFLLLFILSTAARFLNLEIMKFVDSNLGSGVTVKCYYGEVRKAKWLWSVITSDIYIEISSSVSYLRIIDLPLVPVVSFSLPSSFVLVVAPSFQSQPVV